MGAGGMSGKYKITVEGEDLNFEGGTIEEKARRIVSYVVGDAELPTEGAESTSKRPGAGASETLVGEETRPSLSLREFLDDSGATRKPEQILAIGKYATRYEGQQDFSREDIKRRFRSAGEPPPGNFPRDFAWTIKVGWIAEDSQNAGQYYITNRGEEAIQSKFSSEVRKASRLKKGSRRRGIEPQELTYKDERNTF